MKDASKLLRDYARTHGLSRFSSAWTFSRSKLKLKSGSYVHFSGKGWQCSVIIQWLAALLTEEVGCDPRIKTAIWSANNIMGLLHEARKNSMFLTANQVNQVQVIGRLFLSTYLRLHVAYQGHCVYKLYHVRPKFHILTHLLEDSACTRNPCLASCWLDESWLKNILAVARKVHKNTAPQSILTRYLAGVPLHRYICMW